MNVDRDRGRESHTAQMYIEIDSLPGKGLEDKIRAIPGILNAMILLPVQE